MEQIRSVLLGNRYLYIVFHADIGIDKLYMKGYQLARCKCCDKPLTSNRDYWIVARDPYVQRKDEPISEAEKLEKYTLQHGPFTQVEADDFIDYRVDRIEALKR